MAQEKAWQDYWTGGDGDEAVGGPHRHKLAARWTDFFAALASAARAPLVVDIAAGRGAALRNAMTALGGSGMFLALDYSPAAAASAQRALSPAMAAAADAGALPLADRCADAVISQFGVEYAGFVAFAEAARILAPGGRFCSISHYRGGAIDAECAENERLILAACAPPLFEAARRALAESFRRRARGAPDLVDPALERALAEQIGASAATVRTAPPSAARATLERFLPDLSRLSARRLAFEATDALGWLDGMEASLGAYLGRMTSMRAAALDQDAVARVASSFSDRGLVDVRANPLFLDDNRPPAAWVIEAGRP
ncbi:MAG: methyltransferase domain-containing protein [Parvularculaceae bacterium]